WRLHGAGETLDLVDVLEPLQLRERAPSCARLEPHARVAQELRRKLFIAERAVRMASVDELLDLDRPSASRIYLHAAAVCLREGERGVGLVMDALGQGQHAPVAARVVSEVFERVTTTDDRRRDGERQ